MSRVLPAFALACLALAPFHAASQSADEAAARAVANTFSQALASGDSTVALALLHPEVAIFEGGRWETLDEYRSGTGS